MNSYHAFTCKFPGIIRQLTSEAFLIVDGRKESVKALWDTGATCTCISSELASRLSLKSVGKIRIHTPSGQKDAKTYCVDIALPNNVWFGGVQVSDSDIGKQGLDMLIGMDIISAGTLAVSNYEGKTTFSFVCPSFERVDFSQRLRLRGITSRGHMKKKK